METVEQLNEKIKQRNILIGILFASLLLITVLLFRLEVKRK